MPGVPAPEEHRGDRYPLGAAITLEELDRDPHPALARLRAREPVSWVPALGGWLVTRHDLVLAAMRDARTFTVEDPRFSTARVVGPSMLSLDGDEHALHRAPFMAPFRLRAVRERFSREVEVRSQQLIDSFRARGCAELRREFAGPPAAEIIAGALGLEHAETARLLSWYETIVASVSEITAGGPPTRAGELAYEALSERLRAAIATGGSLLAQAAGRAASGASDMAPAQAVGRPALSQEQIASNAAVLLFGGIETTEGMIANLLAHLLTNPDRARAAGADPGALDAAIDESLRLEPAAAVIDRYSATSTELGGARIGRRELVRLSLAAANRDPAVFAEPDAFTPGRPNAGRQLAFAAGPHVCVGVHLARLEARIGVDALLRLLPGLALRDRASPEVRGLVFRKPARVDATWG